MNAAVPPEAPPPDRTPPAGPPPDPRPRRRDERRAIPVDLDAHHAWVAGLSRHVHRPVLGPLFVAINVAVFVVMAANGVSARTPTPDDLVRWGANTWTRSLDDQPWRLLTSGFLHIGLLHLAVNSLALIQLRLAEQVLGRSGWLATYLVAIVAGSLLSAARHEGGVSAGASGGIFGLLGAVLAVSVAPRHQTGLPDEVRQALRSAMLQTLVLNAFVTLSVPHIDHWAHGGGLVAGFCVAIAIVRPPDDEHARGRPRRALVAAAVAAVVLTGAFFVTRPSGAKLERARAATALEHTRDDLEDARIVVNEVLDALRAPEPLPADLEARLDAGDAAFRRATAAFDRYAAAGGLPKGRAPTEELTAFVVHLRQALATSRAAVAARRQLEAGGGPR